MKQAAGSRVKKQKQDVPFINTSTGETYMLLHRCFRFFSVTVKDQKLNGINKSQKRKLQHPYFFKTMALLGSVIFELQ